MKLAAPGPTTRGVLHRVDPSPQPTLHFPASTPHPPITHPPQAPPAPITHSLAPSGALASTLTSRFGFLPASDPYAAPNEG
jgi:hypothetical protein